ncbi:MAG: mRNA surveillance protein Pelota [Desulfurococcaceae archaeon]
MEEDLEEGAVKVLVEDEQDLWLLSLVVEPGDLVTAQTLRDVSMGEGGESRRLPMTLTIKVKFVELQRFTDRARIGGTVVEGPKEFGVRGKHHTLSIGPGSVVIIKKESWNPALLKALRRGLTNEAVLVVSVDYEEACVGILTESGVKVLASRVGRRCGKEYECAEGGEDYIGEVAKAVLEAAERHRPKAIVIGAPITLQKDLESAIASAGRGKFSVHVEPLSVGGCDGIYELVRREGVRTVLGELRIARAAEILEEAKRLLASDPCRVALGVDEVSGAAEIGAIGRLLVSSASLRNAPEDVRTRLLKAMASAHERGAEVVIAPDDDYVLSELVPLGGVVAILRYAAEVSCPSRGSNA